MKKIILVLACVLATSAVKSQEKFGRTLNVGFGFGYYQSAPALNINYEFDVFKNFTLAPFVSVMTYRSNYYWGDVGYPYRYYYYRETIIPIGVKGTYYFDELLKASDRWDFYAAASIGAAFRTTTWESGYYGGHVAVRRYSGPLYGDLHIGTECHLTPSLGLYLDVSTGLSTLGLGFHF